MSETIKGYWDIPDPAFTTQSEELDEKSPITLEVINNDSDMEELETEWEDLVKRSSTSVFQTFDWQYLWWKHFGSQPNHHLYLVVFRQDGELVGIAPFFVQSHSVIHFRIFRRLMLLGSGLHSWRSPLLALEKEGPTDYMDIIAARGFEERVSRMLVRFLIHESSLWDEIDLQNVPEGSILMTHVVPLLEPNGLPVRRQPDEICPYAALPDSLDAFLSSLRRSVRRNLRHAQREFLGNASYEVGDIARKGNTDDGLQVLARLHQRRWNATGYPGLFSDPRYAPFMKDLARAMRGKDRLWFRVIRHEGKAIAVNLGFKFNRRWYGYMSGFDHDAGSSSDHSGAGSALVLQAVIDSLDSGFTTFDMGRGTEEYKFQLTSTVARNWQITVSPAFNEGRSGRILLFRLMGTFRSLAARLICEAHIFTTIRKEKGLRGALPGYLNHLARRLTQRRVEHVPQVIRQESEDDSSSGGSADAIAGKSGASPRNGHPAHNGGEDQKSK